MCVAYINMYVCVRNEQYIMNSNYKLFPLHHPLNLDPYRYEHRYM